MRIDPDKCVACGNCVAVCPMSAIHIDRSIRRAVVNADECVECYSCHRGMSFEHLNPTMVRMLRGALGLLRLRFDPEPDVCPTAAIMPDELEWPRTVRRAFSDVTATHESTGIHGRARPSPSRRTVAVRRSASRGTASSSPWDFRARPRRCPKTRPAGSRPCADTAWSPRTSPSHTTGAGSGRRG